MEDKLGSSGEEIDLNEIKNLSLQPKNSEVFEDLLSVKVDNQPGSKGTFKGPHVHATAYKALHESGYILHVRHPSIFQMLGYLTLRIVSGGVRIFGYDLSTSSRHTEIIVYGSELFQSFQIRTNSIFENDVDELKEMCQNLLSPEDLTSMTESISKHDAVLYVEPVVLERDGVTPNYGSLSAFSMGAGSYCPSIWRNIRCVIADVCHDRYGSSIIGDAWDNVKAGQRTITVARGGCGKSVVTRFLVNKLLMEHKELVYLDLRLGEGELVPPGCIGVYVVNMPMLGPHFIYSLQAELMYHIGAVNASKKAVQYIKCVQSLVNFIDRSSKLRNLPCVVNTMGFWPGLGEKIIRAVISILQPSTIIEMISDESDVNRIINFENWQPEENFLIKDEGLRKGYDYYLIKSAREVLPFNVDVKRMPKQRIRDLLLIAHFSQILKPPLYSFHSASYRKLSLNDIVVGITNKEAPEDVLSALNGSLVALCELPRFEVKKLQGLKVMFLRSSLPCLALAVVKQIEMSQKEVHLLTYLSPFKLKRIKLIALSNIQVPQALRPQGDAGAKTSEANDDVLSFVEFCQKA